MPHKPATFRPPQQRTRQQVNRDYDLRRGSARERGYDHRWDVSATLYKRTHPLCVGCAAVGRVKAAEVVDHILPHKGDHALMWDQANRQSCCAWHHDVCKQKLEALYDMRKIGKADLRLDSQAARRLTMDLDP